MNVRRRVLLLAGLALGSAGLLWLGSRSPRTAGGVAPPMSALEVESTPYPPLAPPAPGQVHDALQRVFGGALKAEVAVGAFFVADFNGDGSEDLAVVARPLPSRLAAVNAPLANWTIQDTLNPPGLDGGAKARRPTVKDGDRVLAVIHGSGASGWRDPEARQAYLLRNGAGRRCRRQSPQELRALPPPGTILPRVRGDVLLDLGMESRRFLFWNGGRYVWHSLPPAGEGSRPPPAG